MTQSLIGNEVSSNFSPATQVYQATHEGGGKRLPFMYRSFISFSYGGKIIEDFNLISVTDGDRINRDGYAQFDDISETYDVIDGQIYWGSHHTTNNLELKLATDGITEKQLDDFKMWFKPGIARELILAEHPNRAIMARVANPPIINMLPFESNTKTWIRGIQFDTKITLYKGEITLNFIMDEPYWYAKHNIISPFIMGEGANGVINVKDDAYRIEKLINDNYIGSRLYLTYRNDKGDILDDMVLIQQVWVDENGYWWIKCESSIPVDILDEASAYKTLILQYPDNIIALYTGTVTLSGIDDRVKDVYNSYDYIKIINEDNIPHLAMIKDPILLGEDILVENSQDESKIFNTTASVINGLKPYRGARVQTYGYIGFDAASWSTNIEVDVEHPQYLFYSGNAPSKPTLHFTFQSTFNNNDYINLPRNSFSHPDEIKENNYNYIQIGEQKFKFTTPSLITGYNQAINIIKNLPQGTSFSELLILLKEKINEYYARAWAIFCAKTLENNTTYVDTNTVIKTTFLNEFITRMKYLVCSNGTTVNTITCSFNSKDGTATVQYNIRAADVSPNSINSLNDINNISRIDIEENAGDMVKSNYLIIDGRCYPSSNGYITKRECIKITTDFVQPLTGLSISFQNMYY